MKRGKLDWIVSPSRLGMVQLLMCVLFIYLLFISFQIPFVLRTGFGSISTGGSLGDALPRPLFFESEANLLTKPDTDPDTALFLNRVRTRKSERRMREFRRVSSIFLNNTVFDGNSTSTDEFSLLHRRAKTAFLTGNKLWVDLESGKVKPDSDTKKQNRLEEPCPHSVSLSGFNFSSRNRIMVLPCGLTLGSHITVVGMPRWAHPEHDPRISMVKEGSDSVMVSQFMMELQGLKTVDGEDPPRILHFNPRLKGDWSGKPVIEQNTCYRMQWGSAQRCDGSESRADEETVDGQVKCERWGRDDDNQSEESMASWLVNRLIGRRKKMTLDWSYPFSEGKLFVLTLRAGLEGYHLNVDGRHVTSFPYRTGFVLEDATGLSINGDIDIYSVFAASLPSMHPSFTPQKYLDMSSKWRAPTPPNGTVELFIGILSAGNHFAERMAVRKSWLQHNLIQSSKVVARFFVALHGRSNVNVELKKEAEYFGDIVIVPYMDNYDLVVLKTVAICEYGVRTVAANYVMKCDDDTFVRVDTVMKEAKKLEADRSIYIGNINYYHKPLRYGKWAVTYEEWPEEDYPPYANGPGYIISSDIAEFVVDEFEEHKLRLFKMEDVSMGMWVEKFNSTKRVEYIHSVQFCQFGCIEDYYTAHYQSPRQMICLWDKLRNYGKPQCCNMRRL